ncbi:MAG: TolC family protein [Prevotellaceae bacterium]|jgi:outer membrane protein TolC|nr:TolC family protein [Prevotellaceae bacterium]
MRIKHWLYAAGWCCAAAASAQTNTLELTLEQTIERAREQSPDARAARHTYRAAYWNYKYHQANYLPALTLTSSPGLNHEFSNIAQSGGGFIAAEQNYLSTDLSLNLSQNIAWTGGTFSVSTGLGRLDDFIDDRVTWQTVPVSVNYTQSLFGYNSLKWNRRIEPIRYAEAKKSYAETLELVAAEATREFFALATAQTNLEIARTNYANADTLYLYAQGRYNIGTITENEMLQLEVNKLTEETNLMNAQIDVENATLQLCSYLGIQENVTLKACVSEQVPSLQIDLPVALSMARTNNPDMLGMRRRQLQGQSSVAQARANAGLRADLSLSFGLSQSGERLSTAYRKLSNMQRVSLGIVLPILDWGRGKGNIRVARSQLDLINSQVEQEQIDFDQNVRKLVMQFNLQARRVNVAARTDETAQRRADVARRLYILGKSSVLDLNASITEKDRSRRDHISALYTYWNLYYTLRSLTLFDFEQRRELTEELEELIK